MKSFFNHLIRKPTFISVTKILFFLYIVFLVIYKVFDPLKTGSSYNMILETLLIFSIVPLILFSIDRLLVMKINNIKLTIIETIVLLAYSHTIFYLSIRFKSKVNN